MASEHKPNPPLWAKKLLHYRLPAELSEEIEGDLDELFDLWVEEFGIRKAHWKYIRQALGFIRPLPVVKADDKAVLSNVYKFPLQIKTRSSLNQVGMSHNYLKVAVRNLVRNKVFSVINIVGLALGIGSSLLIFLWIEDEISIGTHYPNSSNLYRIMEHEITKEQTITYEDTPGLLADELKKQFPEIVYAAGFSGSESHLLSAGDKNTKQTGRFAGADWLSMYSIPILSGNAATALQSPGSLVISRKLAEVYFGNPQKALGKVIRLDNQTDCQVTAVFENLPSNTSEQYDFLLNWDHYLQQEPWLMDWGNAGPGTRVQLRSDADPALVGAKLKNFLKGKNHNINAAFTIELFLQPETEAYLYSDFKDGQRVGGRIEYVRLFSVIAVFLLVIACINFMNLTTAQSVKRSREVGVRKVVGAVRSALFIQFLGEAIIFVCLALCLALSIVYFILPVFNELTGKTLVLPFGKPVFIVSLVGILITLGLLAGSYPALYLSSFNPIKVLKGDLHYGSGTLLFRRGLVVFQFVLSMLLIVGTLVIYQQLDYIQTKHLGYTRENLIWMQSEGEIAHNYTTFKQKLLSMPGIQSVSHMQTSPVRNGNTTDGVQWTGKDPNSSIQFHNTWVGYDFTQTMKVRILQGRDFSPGFGMDSSSYLINEVAAERIGYKDPIGQPLTFGRRTGKIVGVIEDFHFNSLHVPIRPLIIRLGETRTYDNILIRTQPGQTRQAIVSLETLCKKLNPDYPFTYSFVDEEYNKLYQSETIVSKLSICFAGLAILIACLGLFGLIAFTSEQRTKEIGIRKVLGATITNIITLLSSDFLKLVLIAIAIAIPLAWYICTQWLENFAYRIALSWSIFAIAALLAIVIAILTVSVQSIKAALRNPVKSLRTD